MLVSVVPESPGRWVYGRSTVAGAFEPVGSIWALPDRGLAADEDPDGLYVTALCLLRRGPADKTLTYDIEPVAGYAGPEARPASSWERSTSGKAKAPGSTLAERAGRARPAGPR